MADNQRDVSLVVTTSTVGSEKIAELRKEVQALGKEGGGAAPGFNELGAAIDNLATQSGAVATLKGLDAAMGALVANEKAAAAASDALGIEIRALSATTEVLAASETAAKAALQGAQQALFDKRQELARMKAETDTASQRTNEFQDTQRRLRLEILDGKAEVRSLGLAYRAIGVDMAEASESERKLAVSIGIANKELTSAQAALRQHSEALQAANAAMAASGIVSTTASAAEVELANAYQKTSASITAQAVALRESKAASEASVAALAKVAAAEREAAAAAVASGKAISDAFTAVGTQSVAKLQGDIANIRASMELLKTSGTVTGKELAQAFRAGEASIAKLEREIRSLTGEMTTADKAANLFKGTLGAVTAGNLIADGVFYLIQKVKDLGAAFVGTIVQTEQLRKGLLAVYGSTEIAEKQLAFLRKTATEAGVSFGSLEQEFLKFAAATKTSNIPLEQTNELFSAVVRASGALGLSSEQTAGALNALGQMASKGVVSMEELRQQLGDRLPGALSLAAQGFGITDQQLIKLVTSGNLATRDFFPAFTKGLQTVRGEVDGIQPTFANFTNALRLAASNAGDAGWTYILAAGMKGLALVVGTLVMGLTTLAEMFLFVGKAAAALTGVLTGNLSVKQAMSELGTEVDQAVDRQAKLVASFRTTIAGADALTGAQGKSVVATNAATNATIGLIEKNDKLSASQKAAEIATVILGDASLDAGAKIVRLGIYYAELLATQAKDIEAKDRLVKATKDYGDALVGNAALEGSAIASAKAATLAAEQNAAAAEAAAVAHRQETELLTAQLTSLQANAAERGLSTEAIKVQTDAIEGKIKTSQAETEQAVAKLAVDKAEVAQRKLVSESLKDNSKFIDEYRAAAAALEEQIRLLHSSEARGIDVSRQLVDANRALSFTLGLVKDGYADQARNVQLAFSSKEADLRVTLASASAHQTHYEKLAEAARRNGDLTKATYYQIQAKQTEIEILKLSSALKKLEAEAELATIAAQRDALIASGETNKAKFTELEIRAKLATIKQIEAGASVDLVRALEQEISAIRNTSSETSVDTSARLSNAAATDTQRVAVERLSAETSRSVAKGQSNKTGDGLDKAKDGAAAGSFNNLTPVDKAFAIANKQKNGTLTGADLADAQAASDQAKAARAFLDSMQQGSISSVSNEAISSSDALVSATTRALENARDLAARDARGQNKPSGAGSAAAGVAPSAPADTKTININIGGKLTSVTVASSADSAALTSVLRQIEAAAGVSV